MWSAVLGADLRGDKLLPGYFFFGEETYLSDRAVTEIAASITGPEGEAAMAERYYLEDTPWAEILDSARTVPFLFQDRKLIVVTVPERKAGASAARAARKKDEDEGDDEEKGVRFLTASDQALLKAYFADPPQRTTLVVVRGGRFKKTDTVVKFFSSLARTAVLVKELKPLGAGDFAEWADRAAGALGKVFAPDARNRLYEIVGSDLRLLANEIEKLAAYTGDRKRIDAADVDEVTAWSRSFESYELDDALGRADFSKLVVILGSLLEEGESPELIIGRLASYFRGVLLAQTMLKEKTASRQDIFYAAFPQLSWARGQLYDNKSVGFWSTVDGLSPADLNAVLRRLQRADIAVKSTDAAPRTVLEAFLDEYCLIRRKRKTELTSRAPGRSPRSAG
jgi:DNA polymerase-3 subunit delta